MNQREATSTSPRGEQSAAGQLASSNGQSLVDEDLPPAMQWRIWTGSSAGSTLSTVLGMDDRLDGVADGEDERVGYESALTQYTHENSTVGASYWTHWS